MVHRVVRSAGELGDECAAQRAERGAPAAHAALLLPGCQGGGLLQPQAQQVKGPHLHHHHYLKQP